MGNILRVETKVNTDLVTAWECWTKPEHITQWNAASPDWHCPTASVDLVVGGRQSSRMEAKDGSFGFEFAAIFTEVVPNEKLALRLEDNRSWEITFKDEGGAVHIIEDFEAESQNSDERQIEGWQSILDNYKRYVESL